MRYYNYSEIYIAMQEVSYCSWTITFYATMCVYFTRNLVFSRISLRTVVSRDRLSRIPSQLDNMCVYVLNNASDNFPTSRRTMALGVGRKPETDPTICAVCSFIREHRCVSTATVVDRIGISVELHICLPLPPFFRRNLFSLKEAYQMATTIHRITHRDLYSGRANGANKYKDLRYNPTNIAFDVILVFLCMQNSRANSIDR